MGAVFAADSVAVVVCLVRPHSFASDSYSLHLPTIAFADQPTRLFGLSGATYCNLLRGLGYSLIADCKMILHLMTDC